MEVKLTTARVLAADPPKRGGSLWLRDTVLDGLCLRVWAAKRNGVQRAYVITWPDGAGGTRTATIGHHGRPWKPDPETGEQRILTLELARQEATRLLGSRYEGKDPALVRKSSGRSLTLRAFAPRYLTDWSAVEKAPRTAAEERGNLERHLLPLLGDEPLASITAAHVSKLKGALRSQPVTANRCRSLLSVVLNVAKTWGELPASYMNPCALVPPFDEQGRQRPLSVDELARVGPAMLKEESAHPIAVAAIRTLMLTGARPVEVLGIRRAQLVAAASSGVIVQESRKHAKKRRPLYVNPLALAVMAAAPAVEGNPFLFPGAVPGRPLTLSAVEDAWERIRMVASGWTRVRSGTGWAGARGTWIAPKKPGIDVRDVNLYDLRHTFGTVAAMVATNVRFVQDLLGHSNIRTTEKYMHLGGGAVSDAGAETAAAITKALNGGDTEPKA